MLMMILSGKENNSYTFVTQEMKYDFCVVQPEKKLRETTFECWSPFLFEHFVFQYRQINMYQHFNIIFTLHRFFKVFTLEIGSPFSKDLIEHSS